MMLGCLCSFDAYGIALYTKQKILFVIVVIASSSTYIVRRKERNPCSASVLLGMRPALNSNPLTLTSKP